MQNGTTPWTLLGLWLADCRAWLFSASLLCEIHYNQSRSIKISPFVSPPPPNPVLFLWRILSLYYFLIFDIARFFYFFQVFLHFLRPSLFHMTFGVSFSIPQKGPRDFNQKCTQITDSGELKFHKTESDLQTSF